MKVAVFGAGTMGSGIAQVFAAKGHTALMYASSVESAQRHKAKLAASLEKRVAIGKMTEEVKEDILSRVLTPEFEEAADADLVFECVAENMEVKKELLGRLDAICKESTIFASNTSSLSITEMAKGLKHQFIGIHFFNPVPAMKLVEIVSGADTSEELKQYAAEIVESLGKTAIFAQDYPGFIVNYLQYPFRLHAIRMVERGLATPEDIDTAAKLGLGHPKGPLELQDMVGLDITYNACSAIYKATGDPTFQPPALMKKMIDEGRLGRKTGKGFYRYDK